MRTALVREVGPLAWVVLEELTLNCTGGAGGESVVTTTAPLLAQRLGVGRDAVNTALGRLLGVGVITRDSDRGRGGRFAGVTYRVSAHGLVIGCAAGPGPVGDEAGSGATGDGAAGAGQSRCGGEVGATPISAHGTRPDRARRAPINNQLNLLLDDSAPAGESPG